MAYIFQWDILETEVHTLVSDFPDTIKRIKFALVTYDVESEGEETTFIMKDVYLPNPTSDRFIPFNQLKHSDLVNFIVDICGQSDIEYMKNSMLAELEGRKNKKIIKPKIKSPWAQEQTVIQENVPTFKNQLEYLMSKNDQDPII